MYEHFSTRRVSQEGKVAWWNNLLQKTYPGLSAAPARSCFDAEIFRWDLGDILLTRPRSSAAVVTRQHSQATRSQANFAVHLVHQGSGYLRQRGREVSLRSGDLVVCASDEPYRFEMDGQHELLVIEFKKDKFEGRVPGLDELVAVQFVRDAAAVRILHQYILSMWREGEEDLANSMVDGLSCTLLDLLALSMKERSNQTTRPDCHPLLVKMKQLVEWRITDTALSPSTLAGELGVSLRTLQSVLAAQGTTPLSYILERRLRQASEILLMERDRQIIDVAYQCGFSDSNYFARQFRKRFGQSPSEFRINH